MTWDLILPVTEKKRVCHYFHYGPVIHLMNPIHEEIWQMQKIGVRAIIYIIMIKIHTVNSLVINIKVNCIHAWNKWKYCSQCYRLLWVIWVVNLFLEFGFRFPVPLNGMKNCCCFLFGKAMYFFNVLQTFTIEQHIWHLLDW